MKVLHPERRSEILKIPLTKSEKDQLASAAAESRSRLAPFARQTLLDKRPKGREQALMLARINANLLIIAREISRSHPPYDALRLLLALQAIARVVKAAATHERSS